MTDIDWSTAPEWAAGHGLIIGGFGIEPVWFNAEQYQPVQGREGYGPYPFGGGTGPHMHNTTIGQIQFRQHRPVAWTGEGLPPVGTVCEFKSGHSQFPELSWSEVRIVSHDSQGGRDFAVFASMSGYGGCSNPADFRPIRTPEQIEADEREESIEQMEPVAAEAWRNCQSGDDMITVICRALYDAGYRKQEKPE